MHEGRKNFCNFCNFCNFRNFLKSPLKITSKDKNVKTHALFSWWKKMSYLCTWNQQARSYFATRAKKKFFMRIENFEDWRLKIVIKKMGAMKDVNH